MSYDLKNYPAALYSSVAETGYRRERLTESFLRSGRSNRQSGRRFSRPSWLRLHGRHVSVHRMPHAHAR
jgi:hypothetical protein